MFVTGTFSELERFFFRLHEFRPSFFGLFAGCIKFPNTLSIGLLPVFPLALL